MGVLEPIPAATGREVGYVLDGSPVHCRAATSLSRAKTQFFFSFQTILYFLYFVCVLFGNSLVGAQHLFNFRLWVTSLKCLCEISSSNVGLILSLVAVRLSWPWNITFTHRALLSLECYRLCCVAFFLTHAVGERIRVQSPAQRYFPEKPGIEPPTDHSSNKRVLWGQIVHVMSDLFTQYWPRKALWERSCCPLLFASNVFLPMDTWTKI